MLTVVPASRPPSVVTISVSKPVSSGTASGGGAPVLPVSSATPTCRRQQARGRGTGKSRTQAAAEPR